MVCDMKSMLLIGSFVATATYLILAAVEDSQSFQVTRWKHLIGMIPALLLTLVYIGERSVLDMGMILLFVLLWVFLGRRKVYGMADGFVFVNLTVLFGSIGGVAGIGLVILILILACFSGMAEMLLRKMVTVAAFKRKKYIAFVPHILTGYVAVVIALFIWL